MIDALAISGQPFFLEYLNYFTKFMEKRPDEKKRLLYLTKITSLC